MLGTRFDEALHLARHLHRKQTRGGQAVPYMAHLMAVAGIVLEANAYHEFDNIEDVAIGALLHDAVEDQGHQIDLEEIRQRFGDKVCEIVHDCSDAIIEEEHQQKAPWRERKEAYINKIKDKCHESLLVSCADKLHNVRSILFDHARIGDKVFDRFKPGKAETLWYYESLVASFEEAWPKNPLLPDFKAVVRRLRDIVEGGKG